MDANQISIILGIMASWLVAIDILGDKRALTLEAAVQSWLFRTKRPTSTFQRVRNKGDRTRTRLISNRNALFLAAFMASTATAIHFWESERWIYAWPLKLPSLAYGWVPDLWVSGSVLAYITLGITLIVTGRLISLLRQLIARTPQAEVAEHGYSGIGCLLQTIFYPTVLLLLPFIPAAFVGAFIVYSIAFLIWLSIWIVFLPLRLSFSVSGRYSIEHPMRFLGLILGSIAGLTALTASF